MAKFETNLSKKDKMTIAIVLFVGLAFCFVWYLIKPTIVDIRTLSDNIEEAEISQAEARAKVMGLVSAESVFQMATADLAESTSGYYEIMTSSQIDRMATNYVLSFGLFPEQLSISMPSGPVEELPYLYSEAFTVQTTTIRAVTPSPTPTPISTSTSTESSSDDDSSSSSGPVQIGSLLDPYLDAKYAAQSTTSSGVMAVDLTLVMTGSESSCQALIDDLCTKPAIRITGFEWSQLDRVEVYNEETGEVALMETDDVRLRVNLRLYMTDVADYEALVSEAVQAAGSEG